ncbi:MAG: Flp pilus assembly protein TadD, partial [Myxococcota bacterium]
SVVCLGLAYWSKNTAITLPAILVVLSLLHTRQSPLRLRWWIQWVPYGLLALLGLALTLHVGGMVAMMSPVRAESGLGVFIIEIQVILRYLGMIVWPAELSIRYPEPGVVSLSSPTLLAGLGAVGGLLAVAGSQHRSRPMLSLGILWFFITLLPVSQIVPIQNLMADRYLLLPSAGLILAGVSLLPPDILRKPVGLVAAGGILLALSVATWDRSGVWHSSQALWADLVEKHPTEPHGWTALIGVAVEDGRLDEAECLIAQALTVLPNEPGIHQSQGILLMERGDFIGAEQAFRSALEMSPGLRKSMYNLMLSLRRQGRVLEAVQIGQTLVTEHPLYETAWNGLGALYIDLEQPEEAQSALERAYALNSKNVTTVTNLGNAAFLQGDEDIAARWWREVLRLDPDNQYARRGLEALGAKPPPG